MLSKTPLIRINVKKLHFIHTLTATDDRSSHIKNCKNKMLYYYNAAQCTSSYVNVQQFSKITFFIFSVFGVRTAIVCRR